MIIGEGRWGKEKRYHQNCLTFDRIIPYDNRAFKCSNGFIKNGIFLRKFQLVIIGAFQIIRWYHKDSLIFEKIEFKFSNRFNKTALILRKFHLVIIATVQILRIFNWLHKICQIFEKISAFDNKGSSKFQIISTKPPYFWE